MEKGELSKEDGSKGSKGSMLVARSEPEPEAFCKPGLLDVCPWGIGTAGVGIDFFLPFSLFHYFILNMWRQVICLFTS